MMTRLHSPDIHSISRHGHAGGRLAALAALLLLGLAGCEQSVLIQGVVTDVRGARLPGVAVTVQGLDAQTLTDPRGMYSLRCAPGARPLQFLKTDYTPGRLELDTGERRIVDAAEVHLWPLPPGKGVYCYEDGHYLAMTRATPKTFEAKDAGRVLGVRMNEPLTLTNPQPLIICHKVPSYDVQLHRMRLITARPGQEDRVSGPVTAAQDVGAGEQAWILADSITLMAMPIDEPDRLLVELRPAAPLSPGDYAIHWGGFEGHFSTNPHAYLFRILDPDAGSDAATPDAATADVPSHPAAGAPLEGASPAKKGNTETPALPPGEDSGY